MAHPDTNFSSLPKAPPLANPEPHLPGINKMAIASIVCASLLCVPTASLLAVVFGHVALRQLRMYEQDGRGLAIAGLCVGYAGLAFLVIAAIIVRQP